MLVHPTRGGKRCREVEQERERIVENWATHQRELRQVYSDQRTAEINVHDLDVEIDTELERQATEAQERAKAAEAEPLEGETSQHSSRNRFRSKFAGSGLDSATISQLKAKRDRWSTALQQNRGRYEAMTADLNTGLLLTPDHVYDEFSKLSGIEVGRLREDEATKLLELEDTLGNRVVGQPEPVKAVAKAVRRGRTGLKKKNKPVGSFIFLGPTGVGKTELARAHSRFPGHALTPTGVMAIRCKQFHRPDL